jgi:hypothetical protein
LSAIPSILCKGILPCDLVAKREANRFLFYRVNTPARRSGFCKMQITAFYRCQGGDSKNPQDVPNRLCAVTITCLMVKMSCDDSTCSDRPLSSSLPLAYALRERERKCERFQRLRQVKLGRFKKKLAQ